MRNEVVEALEETFLPRLRATKELLEREFPAVRFNVWSSSIGELTPHQGHNVGLDCLFPDSPGEFADNVAIIFGVKYVSTTPLLCEASVAWGHGPICVDLLPSPIAFSAVALGAISNRFNELVGALRSALVAGPCRAGA